MRTILEYMGRPHPVMNCQFKASIYPPLPDKDAPDYSDKCREWEKNPRLLVELEIAFPRYYWRAKYFQEGKEPFFITDCPVKGNAVQLKDCAFLNNVDLKLPGGAVIRGFPHDDMPAELIRKHTAILEQEGLFAREDSEIKAEIARMRRDLEEGVDRIAKAAQDATLPPGKRKWWQNLWASFKTCPDSMKEGEKWEAVARKVLTGVWENASNLNWKSDYLGETTFRNLAKEYRNLKATRQVMKDKLWMMLDRQWTAAQEKDWADKLRRYAQRERDKAEEKTANPEKSA